MAADSKSQVSYQRFLEFEGLMKKYPSSGGQSYNAAPIGFCAFALTLFVLILVLLYVSKKGFTWTTTSTEKQEKFYDAETGNNNNDNNVATVLVGGGGAPTQQPALASPPPAKSPASNSTKTLHSELKELLLNNNDKEKHLKNLQQGKNEALMNNKKLKQEIEYLKGISKEEHDML